jgi:hypothetical protein
MKKAKIKVRFAIAGEIIKDLDFIAKSSEYLQVSRSEPVDAILTAFFKGQEKPMEKARKLLIMRRKGLI